MKGPCKDCERRKLGCHGRCKEYREFKAEREEILKRKNAEHEARWPMSKRGEKLIWKYRMIDRK